ncbi:MAG: hypothetical protein J5590_02050 [Clostridia bacterium]|nr:hypothetical protein [Clostridia bacterium]
MKGIVTDIKDARAVILKSDGTFEKIKNKNYIIGQEIKKDTSSVKKQLLIAACFLLVFTFYFGGVYAYRTPVEYIYVDINPSLRLDINMFHRVISVTRLNTDAESINSFDKKPEKCVEGIIDECIEKGYLNGDNNGIEIAVSDNFKEIETKLNKDCEKYSKSGYDVVVYSADKEDVEYANTHGVSVNRKKASKRENEKKAAEKATVNKDKKTAADNTENSGKTQENSAAETKKQKDYKTSNGKTGGVEGSAASNGKKAGADNTAKSNVNKSETPETAISNENITETPETAKSNGNTAEDENKKSSASHSKKEEKAKNNQSGSSAKTQKEENKAQNPKEEKIKENKETQKEAPQKSGKKAKEEKTKEKGDMGNNGKKDSDKENKKQNDESQ